MGCCSHCFIDSFIQPLIVASPENVGACSFCESQNVNLIEPRSLGRHFESLIEIYVESNDECVFHAKPATDSIASLPPIPRESCH